MNRWGRHAMQQMWRHDGPETSYFRADTANDRLGKETDMTKISRIILMAIVMVGIATVATSATPGDVSKITMLSTNELKNMLNNPNLTIIDVRYEKDWGNSNMKIKGAIREDYMRVETWAENYPKGKFIVLYCACPDERTSARAARELLDRGFTNVRVLKGGWDAWVKAGYPVEKK